LKNFFPGKSRIIPGRKKNSGSIAGRIPGENPNTVLI
jgi:hypothetical protein